MEESSMAVAYNETVSCYANVKIDSELVTANPINIKNYFYQFIYYWRDLGLLLPSLITYIL
jgi:hypothetical protein